MGAFGAFASPFQQLRPINAPSPMEYAAQFGQLEALAQNRELRQQEMQLRRQEQQANQLKLQQAEQVQQNQRILAQAYRESGNDIDKFRSRAIDLGATPDSVLGVEQSLLKHRQEVQSYNTAQLTNYEAQNKAYGNIARAAFTIKDPQRRQEYWQTEGRPTLARAGVPESSLPDALPEGDEFLQTHIAVAGMGDQILKEESERRKADSEKRMQAAQELAAVANPNTGQVEDAAGYDALAKKHAGILPPLPSPAFNQRFMEANLVPFKDRAEYDAQRRLATKPREEWMIDAARVVPAQMTVDGKIYDTSALQERTMAEVKSALDRGDYKGADTVIKDAGKSINATEQAVRTAKATAPVKIEVAGAQAAARAPSVTDEGLDLMAERIINNQNPGTRNPVIIAKATNRAAELLKERGMTAQGAIMAANAAGASKQALNALEKQYALLKPFGEMTEKNAALLEKAAEGVSDLGAPFFNTPLRELQNKFGSDKTAKFYTILQPLQADFARILSSPTGGGQLSDSARHEMQRIIQPGATLGQIRASLGVLRQEWHNRKQTYEAQIQDLTGRTVVGGGGAQQQSEGGGQKQPKRRYNLTTGRIELVNQ